MRIRNELSGEYKRIILKPANWRVLELKLAFFISPEFGII